MEFGYKQEMQRSKLATVSRASDDLYSFIANYVAKSYGMSFINKWLRDNKGKSLLYLTTESDVAYAITLIKNHERVWELDHLKSTLSEDELEMYDNYKDLEDPEEIEKYSPKMPRFSAGTGVKRTFGSVMWNKEGVTFYEKTYKIWTEAFRNGAVWDWLCIGWNAWVIKNNFGNHWRKKKTRKDSTNDMDSNEDDVDPADNDPVEFLLPDDDDFDHNRGQSRMTSPTEEDHLRGGEMGVVSEEKSNERNGDKERLQKTLDSNVIDGDEDGKEKNSKYNDMIYSKVPDSYNAMFPVVDG